MRMRLEVGEGVRVVDHTSATDPALHAVANALLANRDTEPTLEVRGRLRIRFEDEAVVGVAGDAEVSVNGSRVGSWKAVYIPPQGVLEVVSSTPSYISLIKGVYLDKDSSIVGKFSKEAVISLLQDIKARYVPDSFRIELRRPHNTLATIARFRRHLELSSLAAKRGAQLLKVRLNGRAYDVWVEELR